MHAVRSWTRIAAEWLVTIVAGGGLASGQSVALPPVPPPVMPATSPISLETVAPAMAGAPAGVPGAPSCSCGDRRGLSRWRWHRTQCKRHLQEHFFGYPEEFNEWPLGYAMYASERTQISNAQAGNLVFYHYDFQDGTSRLNQRGQDKLAKLGMYLPTSFSPIVVERTPKEAGLDESRRLALVRALGRGSFPVPEERIVIGPSFASDISGIEALPIYSNQVRSIASGGSITGGVAGIGGFVGGGSGFDGGGLSGSAVTAVPR